MNAEENKTSQLTPEQLLKMLDIQMDTMRSKRTQSSNRHTVRILSITLTLMILFGAIFVLMNMLDDLRGGRPSAVQTTGENTGR